MYKRGGYSVTILDKAQILPAPDAASTDINKIIRSGDYADPTIAALNVDAVNEWRKPEWEGTYHEYVRESAYTEPVADPIPLALDLAS